MNAASDGYSSTYLSNGKVKILENDPTHIRGLFYFDCKSLLSGDLKKITKGYFNIKVAILQRIEYFTGIRIQPSRCGLRARSFIQVRFSFDISSLAYRVHYRRPIFNPFQYRNYNDFELASIKSSNNKDYHSLSNGINPI
ncbi:MAG: hypothetical protein IPN26_03630 [Bacteroidetes bacterium]|nr:hypothetical protein [Bacteroidota bacterium]